MLEPAGAQRARLVRCVPQGAERNSMTLFRPSIVPLLAALTALMLTACAGLPPRGEPLPSHALADTDATALARLARESRPQDEVRPSGFRLLPTGEFAFNARVALVRRAERSVDMQTYHLQRDHAGRTILRELRDAARRGVRVRLLVDDFYAAPIDDLLAGLAAEPGAEVRLFNPMALRIGAPVLRVALSPGDFERNNHRMHNKLFVADNAVALYGGRNVADEYFMSNPEANFIDMDVLSTGTIVKDFSAVFDTYWNSEQVWPVARVLGAAADSAALRAAFDDAVRDATPQVPVYQVDPLGQTGVDAQLVAGRLELVYASARVHVDPPEKALLPPTHEPTAAMSGLLRVLANASHNLTISSPYFVPNATAMGMMRTARSRGVEIRVVTNSISSTDEPLVHYYYSARRPELLRMGVQLYEISPALTQRANRFGSFGKSTPRLHAKVAVVDQHMALVGSVNLDSRSATGNTEMGVVIDSPVLAKSLLTLMSGTQMTSMYRLRLAEDGHTIEWLSTDEQGRVSVAPEEPEHSAWLRFKLWLQSLVVSDRLL